MDQSANRPKGLYIVGVVMMLFGLLGLCSQGFTVVGTVQQRGGSAQSEDLDPAFAELGQLQEEMFVPHLVSASLGVGVALALLVFGALVVAQFGAALLAPTVLLVAASVELLQLGLSVYFQMRMVSAMDRFTSGFEPGPGAGTVEGFLSAATGIGLCVIGGWALAKCAFFGAGMLYLRKPEIRRLFEAPPALGPRGD